MLNRQFQCKLVANKQLKMMHRDSLLAQVRTNRVHSAGFSFLCSWLLGWIWTHRLKVGWVKGSRLRGSLRLWSRRPGPLVLQLGVRDFIWLWIKCLYRPQIAIRARNTAFLNLNSLGNNCLDELLIWLPVKSTIILFKMLNFELFRRNSAK